MTDPGHPQGWHHHRRERCGERADRRADRSIVMARRGVKGRLQGSMRPIAPRLGGQPVERRRREAGNAGLRHALVADRIAPEPGAEAAVECALRVGRVIDGIAWHRQRRARERQGPRRHLVARRRIMEDADDRRAGGARLRDHRQHPLAIGRIERGGRLVQQQDRRAGGKAAGDIDPLLLAAGEGDGRQMPEPRRNGEPLEQLPGPRLGLGGVLAAFDQRLGNDIERRHPGYGAEELSHLADGVAADIADEPRRRRRDVDDAAAMQQPRSAPRRRGRCHRSA